MTSRFNLSNLFFDTTTYNAHRQFARRLANTFLGVKDVSVVEGSSNIACVNVQTKTIEYNMNRIFKNRDLVKGMMVFKGLTFHEIQHLVYTVHGDFPLDESQHRVLGMLEDGRIETLAVMNYDKLADYFTYAVNEILLGKSFDLKVNKSDSHLNTYILLYGRKYYFKDIKLMAMLKASIKKSYGKNIVSKIELWIDAFTFESSSKKRVAIAKEMTEYLLSIGVELLNFKGGSAIVLSPDILSSNKKQPNPLKGLTKKIKQGKVEVIELKEEIEQESKKHKPDERGYDDEELDKEITKEMIKAQSELKENEDEKDKLDYDGDEYDMFDRTKYKADLKDIEDRSIALDDKVEELKNSRAHVRQNPNEIQGKEFCKKLEEHLKSKNEEQDGLIKDRLSELKEDVKSLDDLGVQADTEFKLPDDIEVSSRKLRKGLAKLNSELVKGYITKQHSGRLNVRTYLNRKNKANTKVFNRYLPDKIKETKMMVNVFLDGSGSMTGKDWTDAVNSCWIIVDALDKDDNKVMAVQFSERFSKFKTYNGGLTIPAQIGRCTYVGFALKSFYPEIEEYRKANGFKHVIDIVITDGDFDDAKVVDGIIDKMNGVGHETIFINVSAKQRTPTAKFNHMLYCNDFVEMTSKLIKIFSKIKRGLVNKVKVSQ